MVEDLGEIRHFKESSDPNCQDPKGNFGRQEPP